MNVYLDPWRNGAHQLWRRLGYDDGRRGDDGRRRIDGSVVDGLDPKAQDVQEKEPRHDDTSSTLITSARGDHNRRMEKAGLS